MFFRLTSSHCKHPFTQTFPTSLLLLSSLSLPLSFSSLAAIISRQTVNHRLPLSSVGACSYIIPCRSLRHLQLHVFYFILFFFSSIIPLTQITFLIIAFFFRICRTNGLGLFLFLCWPAGHHPIARLTLHHTPYTLCPSRSPAIALSAGQKSFDLFLIHISVYIPTHSIKQSAPTWLLANSTYIDQAVFFRATLHIVV